MIDRIQTWLDVHPRARLVGCAIATSAASLLYVAFYTFGFGVIGMVTAAAIILVVNLAGPIPFTSHDAVWGAWAGFLYLGAIVGASVGLIRTAIRVLPTGQPGWLTREEFARGLVAHAVVAHRIGAARIDLRLGILSGGVVNWSFPMFAGGPLASEAFDRLTVQLANPSSLSNDGFTGRTSFDEITRRAEEIVIRDAMEGVSVVSTAELIEGAARRARMILDEVGDEALLAIEAELLRAGRIRERRFLELLEGVEAPRAGVEVLF